MRPCLVARRFRAITRFAAIGPREGGKQGRSGGGLVAQLTGERERRLGRAILAALPALRRYAVGLCGNASLADDLVQNCVERALRGLGTLHDENRLKAWLRSILFSVFIDDRRQWHSRVETLEPDILEAMVDETVRPDVRHELAQTLQAMTRLTPQHRQALLLVGVEGLSYRETAEELGLPIGTVMSRLARARDQLREALGAERSPERSPEPGP